MTTRPILNQSLRCYALALVAAVSILAQSSKVTVLVQDPTGSVIPQARVRIGVVSAETNEQGQAILVGLAPGNAELIVEKSGFARAAKVMHIQSSETDLTVTLAVDAVGTSVTVTEAAPVLAGGQIATEGRVGVLGDLPAQRVPFSVRSYTDTFLKNIQALSVSDALVADASFVSAQPSARSSPFFEHIDARGFEITVANATSINGLFGIAGILPNVDTIERIDTFKGPSAFLNGAPGAVGGTINFAPKRARSTPLLTLTPDYLGKSVLGGHLDASHRFGRDGAFGVRLNGNYRGGDGVIQHNQLWSHGASLGADYRFRRARISLDVQNDRAANRGYTYYVSLAPGVGFPAPMKSEISTQAPWLEYGTRNTRTISRAEFDIGRGWTATGALGHTDARFYNDWCTVQLRNYAGDVTCVQTGFFGRDYLNAGDGGVRGKLRTGAVTHTLIAGGNVIAAVRNSTGAMARGSSNYNLYRPFRPFQPSAYAPVLSLYKAVNQLTSGFYIGDTVGLFSDRLLLTAGVRRSTLLNESFNPAGVLTSGSQKSAYTPALAALYAVSSALSIYGSYVQALEPGGVAPAIAINAGTVFPPLVSNQIETGAKWKFRRWEATGALYRIQKANQFLDLRTNIYSQDGLQENRGFEFSFTGDIYRGLRAIATTSFIDATLLRTAGGVFDGKTPASIADAVGRLYLDWDVPKVKGLTLNGVYLRTGSSPFDNANTLTVPAWQRFDMGCRYTLPGERGTVFRLSVENVSANRYWMGGYPGGMSAANPRVISASITKSIF